MQLTSKAYINLHKIQHLIKQGKLSCLQVVRHYLQRIETHKYLNVYLEVFAEEALTKAQRLDDKIKDGLPLGKLWGMVVGIKDVICYKNHKVSAASKILENFESTFSATAIERLIQEDAIIIGRINCDEFAMGSTNENSAYGAVKNHYNNECIPGGSSGGSAVAVQADLCLVSLGSDTGGSVRQPAAFCDVIGVKPSYGRISRHGLIAYASSFDQIGILSRSVEDAALLLEVMAGPDDFDSTAAQQSVPNYSQQLVFNGKARIAYFKEAIHHSGLDSEIRQQMLQQLQQLKEMGHVVEEVKFPLLQHIVPTYYILTTAEASSNLARYDGLRYGYRSKQASNLNQTYKQSRSEGFGSEVKRRIMLGTFVLSAGYYDAYYAKAQKVRRLLYEHTQQILQQYDFIVTPTTPTTAFKLGDKDYQDPVAMYLSDIFTVHANLVGMPAVSLPLFKHSNGMPFGWQMLSSKFNEQQLLAFSHLLMQHKQNLSETEKRQ